MRAYFFAFLGIVFYMPDISLILLSIGLTASLIGSRYLAIILGTLRMKFSSSDRVLISLICGRGLAAAVLADLVSIYGL